MAFLDDDRPPVTQAPEPPDPEADARAAALTPERTAMLAVEIDGLGTLLVAKALEMGMTAQGFLMTMAHQWQAKRRVFDNAKLAGEQLAKATAEKNRQQEAARAAAAPPSGGPTPGDGPEPPAGGAGQKIGCSVEGCDEPQAHTHLVSGKVLFVPGPDVDCPLIDCRIAGPHDHGVDSADATEKEPR